MCGTFLPSLHRGEGERLPSILVLSPQPVRGSSGGGGGVRIPGSILVSVLRLLKRTRGGRKACKPSSVSFFSSSLPAVVLFCPSPLPPPLHLLVWSSSASEGAGRFTVPLPPSLIPPPGRRRRRLVCESECLLHLRSDFQVGSVGGVSLHSQGEGNVNEIKQRQTLFFPPWKRYSLGPNPPSNSNQKNTKSHSQQLWHLQFGLSFSPTPPQLFLFHFFGQEPRSDCGGKSERQRPSPFLVGKTHLEGEIGEATTTIQDGPLFS